MKYDIITLGSATLDVFIRSKDFWMKKEELFATGQGICFPFPSKVDLESIVLATGGGGTNTAATFAKQGLKTAYCGKIGDDLAGEKITQELKEGGVRTKFLARTKEKSTNYSVVFSLGYDRTCFVWRGASELLGKSDVPWEKLKSQWLYLAPLSGKLAYLFAPLVNFAYKNKIKIACNPGNSQISLGKKVLKPILSKIDILILNQEEASLLTQIPYQKEKDIFKKLDALIPGIAVMTKGKKGVVVSDGKYLFESKTLLVKCIEKTGAGDALGSGFLAGFIKKGDIPYAIQLGIANAVSCIQKVGAKQGLLKKGQAWSKVKVKKIKL